MMARIALASVAPARSGAGSAFYTLLIGLTAFLTVVDLFATQAILPALTRAYATTPAMMSCIRSGGRSRRAQPRP